MFADALRQGDVGRVMRIEVHKTDDARTSGLKNEAETR